MRRGLQGEETMSGGSGLWGAVPKRWAPSLLPAGPVEWYCRAAQDTLVNALVNTLVNTLAVCFRGQAAQWTKCEAVQPWSMCGLKP